MSQSKNVSQSKKIGLMNRLSLRTLTYVEGSAWALMVNFGETACVIYFSKSQLSGLALGLLMTLPTAIGAVAQGLIPHFARGVSAVRLTLANVVLQMFGLIVMGLSLANDKMNLYVMFLGLCFYYIGGYTAGAPWQEWMSGMIPRSKHNQFFARRSGFVSLFMLIGYLSVGYFINDKVRPIDVIYMISIAFFFRVISLLFLYFHPRPVLQCLEAENSIEKDTPYDNAENIHELENNSNYKINSSINSSLNSSELKAEPSIKLVGEPVIKLGMLCLVIFVFRVAVHISAPFYNPYMLKELNFSIFIFACLNSVPLATRFVLLRNWGRLLDDKRMFEGFCICIIGIAAAPLLWTLYTNVWFIASLQVLSGIVWPGFELVSMLFIQRIYPKNILMSLAFFGAASALGAVVGGVIGGQIVDSGMGFYSVFQVSSVLRLVTGAVFLVYLRSAGAFKFRRLEIVQGMMTLVFLKSSKAVAEDRVGRAA